MTQYIDESEFLSLFKPGQRVYVGAYTNEPKGLIELLAADGEKANGVTFIQQPLFINQIDLSSLAPESRMATFFMTPALQRGLSKGRIDYIPMQMRAVYDYIQGCSLDIVLLQVAKDINGEIRFGPGMEFVQAALDGAATVVLQVNTEMTAPIGCPPLEMNASYLLLEKACPPIIYPKPEVKSVELEIAKLVSSIIKDGDCLQTGVGTIPEAILSNLTNKNDLGFHGGLVGDGTMKLIMNGNLNGKRKAIDSCKHITGIALGSKDFLDWVARERSIHFKGANYTHESNVIRHLDNFVSINSAMEVDLFGQVNAEFVSGFQVSGTGGSVDFMRAAKLSKNGRSIIAMASTARRGKVSRIVPRVEMVTALRTDVDMVVTEFGIASLKNTSWNERAKKLIEIAHPKFRDELRGTFFSNKHRESLN